MGLRPLDNFSYLLNSIQLYTSKVEDTAIGGTDNKLATDRAHTLFELPAKEGLQILVVRKIRVGGLVQIREFGNSWKRSCSI